ncbi:MAG: FadR/GntR family transcriptional regulator [Acuticoccus sp.]
MSDAERPKKLLQIQEDKDAPVLRSTFSRRSMHGQLATLLGGKIAAGKLPPGAIFPPEAQIMAEFSVSRSVLREALLVLTAKGLVESRQRLGTRVRPREDWNILDPDVIEWLMDAASDREVMEFFEVRVVVEPAVAAIAARQASEADIARIGSAFAEMETSVGSLRQFIGPDLRFHEEIHKASQNQFLTALGRLVSEAVLTLMVVVQVDETMRRARLDLHRAVFENIRDRDPDGAAQAMTALLEEARSDLALALRVRTERAASA